MTSTDRRVERTRELLQHALIQLIDERGYDAITIEDVVTRANMGRTTFYLHYHSKDDLFMSCHEAVVGRLHLSSVHSREALLAPEAPLEMLATYRALLATRALVQPVFRGKDSELILRRIREQSAHAITQSLSAAFAGAASTTPMDLLAHYLAGAQIALVQWWLETRQPHSPELLAQTFHRLQRAAIREAFGVGDRE
jgi:AcrR family transcriptional regulator